MATVNINNDPSDMELASQAECKRWQKRVKSAKKKWAPEFKRMRQNMDFLYGLQWDGQQTMRDGRYIANITIKAVNQKVAALYARNPQVDIQCRERLEYVVWDGTPEMLMDAMKQSVIGQQMMGVAPPEAIAVLTDYQRGRAAKQLVRKVADTLRLLYQYQVDVQRPEFKEQMKQAVARTIICGVSYCRPIFFREGTDEGPLKTTEIPHTVADRARRAQVIMDKLSDGEIERSDEQVERLQSLFKSMGASLENQDEVGLSERLEFDFPSATSIIPDPRCRSLVEFAGASYVAQEFVVPVEDANAFFGTKIEVGGGEGEAQAYRDEGGQLLEVGVDDKDKDYTPLVTLWEVFDYKTKTHSVVCDGWKEWVVEPEAVSPSVSGFWPIFALTFNRVEVEPDTKATIFPPSDVDLMFHAQKEWNRSREALREQRNANAPKYPVRKGSLSERDKEAIHSAKPNSVIELENIPPDVPPSNFIQPLQVARIDPAVYETRHLFEDIQLSSGAQEANLGPAPSNVTATVGTIAEQSRLMVSSSNVDDLDGFLSRIAKAGGEMCLREMSTETVVQAVGIGAATVWPQFDREAYINGVELKVLAASSGKPNQALAIANFERIVPHLLNAGANPLAIIKEGLKRLDENLDPMDFFPIPGLGPMPMSNVAQGGTPEKGQQAPGGPEQPLQEMPSESPIPLAAA